MINLKFKKLHPDAVLPKRAKPGDAGLDITCVSDAQFSSDETQVTYDLGLSMELPPGHVGLLFPRSSIVKTSLSLGNAVGVIDENFRGQVKVVFNIDRRNLKSQGAPHLHLYNKGDRVVQLVVLPIPQVTTEWTDDLSATERGEGGFGSTGK